MMTNQHDGICSILLLGDRVDPNAFGGTNALNSYREQANKLGAKPPR